MKKRRAAHLRVGGSFVLLTHRRIVFRDALGAGRAGGRRLVGGVLTAAVLLGIDVRPGPMGLHRTHLRKR